MIVAGYTLPHAYYRDQANLCRVIEEAGLDLEKGDGTQLYQAMLALIAGVVGSGGGAVPTTRLVQGAGLVSGGGALSADRTLTVTAASPTEAAAQLRNDVAITPLAMAGLMGLTLGSGTQVIRVGPAILMMRNGYCPPNTNTIFPLPDTFPNACLGAFANGGIQNPSFDWNSPFVSGWGVNSISVYNSYDVTILANFLAIGY